MRGFYGEACYRVLSGTRAGDVGLFTRYENFDTQYRMPDGYLPLKEFDRDAFVIGSDLLARSRHRDQGGLLDRQEPELGHRRSQLVQCRSWMVVLMTRIFTRFNIVVTVMGLVAAFGGAAIAARQQQPQVVEISVERFSFTPSEFKVKAGQPVEIRLRSDDTDHGFRILGHRRQRHGSETRQRRGDGGVRAAEARPLVFECSKLCGAGHSFMRGTLIAE